MADLSRVDQRISTRGQPTRNRDALIPQRRQTQAPDLEVNARPQRQNSGAAQELAKILSLGQDAAENFTGMEMERRAQRDDKLASQAQMDFVSEEENPELYARYTAYRRAWHVEGAKSMAVDIDREVVEAVNARLADEDDPATLDDIDELIESLYRSKVLGEDGQPLDFGEPKAQRLLANQMVEARARARTEAAKIIKQRTDLKLLGTLAFNEFEEAVRQKPIGADPTTGKDVSLVDPGASVVADEAPPAAAPARTTKAPTGRSPVRGAVTANMRQHAARGSVGVDIDGRIGDPVEAPAGAKVTKVRRMDGNSGNWVELDHGNGVKSTYAHLSSIDVAEGQIVEAGTVFAKVGNTGRVRGRNGGDGSHLHWRVKANGKDVDPLSYRFAEGSVEGAAAMAADAGTSPTLVDGKRSAIQAYPTISFERAMSRVPPGIDRGLAKDFLLQTFLNIAEERGDPRLLDGLLTSARADGTPSFAPDEIATIQTQREQIKNKVEAEAKRLQSERHEANADIFIREFVDGRNPSRQALRAAVGEDKISPEFAFSIINHMDAEDRRVANEAAAEFRQSAYEADQETAMVTAAEATLLRTGAIDGTTLLTIQRRLDSGEFGAGKKAVAHANTLRAALREGQAVALANPDTALWAAKLKQDYGPKEGGSRVAAALGKGGSPNNYPAMAAEYEGAIKRGETPAQAYAAAVAKYAPKGGNDQAAARAARLKELRERRLAEGR